MEDGEFYEGGAVQRIEEKAICQSENLIYGLFLQRIVDKKEACQ